MLKSSEGEVCFSQPSASPSSKFAEPRTEHHRGLRGGGTSAVQRATAPKRNATSVSPGDSRDCIDGKNECPCNIMIDDHRVTLLNNSDTVSNSSGRNWQSQHHSRMYCHPPCTVDPGAAAPSRGYQRETEPSWRVEGASPLPATRPTRSHKPKLTKIPPFSKSN